MQTLQVEKRDLVKMVLLTVITCGIYKFIWMYNVGNDIAQARGDDQPKPMTDLLLSIVTCGIWYFYVSYNWAKLLNEAAAQRGKRVDDNFPLLCLVLAVFSYGLVDLALMQNLLNEMADGR